MMQRIAPRDVEIGMYVTGFDGPWINHPFWRTHFRVSTEAQLRKIHESSVPAVHVDSNGQEIPAAQSPLADRDVQLPRFTLDLRTPAIAPVQGTAAEREFSRDLLHRSKRAVKRIFRTLRMGGDITVDDIAPVVREIDAGVEASAAVLHNLMAMKTRAEYTHMHSVAVCGLMANFARSLGMSEGRVFEMGMAGLLHDVGKAFIPDTILNKPERLTKEEIEIVQSHPKLGHAAVVRNGAMPLVVGDVCLHHHERMDGKGYPDALAAGSISIPARMGGICDVYDAVTSDRCYKDAWSPQRAAKEMSEWEGHLDLDLLKVFMETVGVFPVGSRLQLVEGGEALVVAESPNPAILSVHMPGRERYNADGALIVENVRREAVAALVSLGFTN